MTSQPSQSMTEHLPRIFSQKKLIRPPSSAKEDGSETTSLRRPRSQSDLHSARKALQSANSSKAVRLEATAVVYLKKIEGLEKQEYLLDKEISEVKNVIEKLRIKRKGGD